ncbi:hypothetical protein HA402_014287 [Bradysia odoriphaga]|nr:hypothetical protein HA402_014287 [Bradysia odoriphaga]
MKLLIVLIFAAVIVAAMAHDRDNDRGQDSHDRGHDSHERGHDSKHDSHERGGPSSSYHDSHGPSPGLQKNDRHDSHENHGGHRY